MTFSWLVSCRSAVVLLLVVGAIGADVSPVRAETSPVAIVDLQRVLTESIAGKAAKNNLDNEIKKRQGSFDKERAELQKLKEELDSKSSLLSAAALEEKRTAFARKERDLARKVQDVREELGKKNRDEISKIIAQARVVTEQIAEKEKYQFVLEKGSSGVLYSEGRLDITDEVVRALDSKKVGL